MRVIWFLLSPTSLILPLYFQLLHNTPHPPTFRSPTFLSYQSHGLGTGNTSSHSPPLRFHFLLSFNAHEATWERSDEYFHKCCSRVRGGWEKIIMNTVVGLTFLATRTVVLKRAGYWLEGLTEARLWIRIIAFTSPGEQKNPTTSPVNMGTAVSGSWVWTSASLLSGHIAFVDGIEDAIMRCWKHDQCVNMRPLHSSSSKFGTPLSQPLLFPLHSFFPFHIAQFLPPHYH